MHKKNIFIVQNTELGWHLALSVFLTNLLKRYKKEELFDYTLICWKIENEAECTFLQDNKIKVHTTETWLYKIKDNILFSWRTFKILLNSHKVRKIDIIHAFYPNSSLLWSALFKLFISWKTKIFYDVRSPWIEMSFANNHLSKKSNIVRNIMHFSEFVLIRFVSEFIFITEWTREYYKKTYKLWDNISSTIIPSGVSVWDFSKPVNPETREKILWEYWWDQWDKVIGYVGNISNIRELDQFLKNNAQWIIDSKYKLIIIWDWDWLEPIRTVIKDNSLDSKVFLLGKKLRTEIPDYIQTFDYWLCHLPDIFVFQNSFPLKVLEYLSAWKPVLCSIIKAHTSIATNFREQIILYDSVIDFWQIPENRTWRSDEIFSYDWSNLYKKYTGIYEKN